MKRGGRKQARHAPPAPHPQAAVRSFPAARTASASPANAEAWLRLAVDAEKSGDLKGALSAVRNAVCLAPASAAAWAEVARISALSDRIEAQISALRRRLSLTPDSGPAHVALAGVYEAVGRLDLAVAELRTAIALAPGDPEARDQLAATLRMLRRFEEAAAMARTTLELLPAHPAALIQYAVTLQSARTGDAEPWYARARAAAESDIPMIDWNRSLALLAGGDLARGWPLYEAGLPAGKRLPHREWKSAARWQGEALTGRTLMTWREQGVGDELVFASCYPDLLAEAGACIIECEPRLVSLFRRSFPGARVRGDTDRAEDASPDFDLHIPNGSLPARYRPTLAEFPARQDYLLADPARVQFWRDRLQALGPGLKVGICWRGRLKTQSRTALYAPLQDWGAILRTENIHFVSLQYGEPEDEIAAAETAFGCHIHRWPDIDLMNDFDDVAAFGRALDLAIVADTAGGALVGAVGTPTWRYVTRGDFMSLGTDRFPWMPAMRVYFREVDQEWKAVTERIARDLATERDALGARWQPPAAMPEAPLYEPPLKYMAHTAMEHQRVGRLPAAAALYRKILTYTPDEEHCLQLLGTIALREGHADRAALLLTRAVRVRPDYAAARVQLGVARRRQNQPAAAMMHFAAALALEPQHPEALANLGEALASTGRNPEARTAFHRAARLRPDIPELETNLGNLQAATGDLAGAAARQRRAIALNPTYADAYLNLASVRVEQGDIPGALRLYDHVLRLAPNHAVALARAKEAERRRQAAAAAPPVDIAALLRNAIGLHRAGSLPEAEHAYRRVLHHDPQQADALHLLGVIALQRGNAASASAHLEAALAIDPAFPQALSNLGRVHDALGQPSAAERSYRRAICIEPRTLEATVHLARARLRNGDGTGAAGMFRRALILAPAHAVVWNSLGEIETSLGDAGGGEAAIRRAFLLAGAPGEGIQR